MYHSRTPQVNVKNNKEYVTPAESNRYDSGGASANAVP
jgi:hypothetical protein